MINIQGKVIVIMGASSGIGEATTKKLAQEGAKLVISARREDCLKALVEYLPDADISCAVELTHLHCPVNLIMGQYFIVKGDNTIGQTIYHLPHGHFIGWESRRNFLKVQRETDFAALYEKIHERFGVKAWMCGRVTMEEHFTLGHQLDLEHNAAPPIPRTDYVADHNAESYAIAVAPSGKRHSAEIQPKRKKSNTRS
ncbi:SDR family NAD(P)-dependent oxidoreductase [Paenibacillus sp. sgz302251]|uniref:SDR family NAD(P)-dependent oxidoreductase n=1 Tax=Paenibacillus sp. sgz302251 TaxID=3414493 RepID=UPI003C7D24E8